jgi:hypothetical protein
MSSTPLVLHHCMHCQIHSTVVRFKPVHIANEQACNGNAVAVQ